MPSFARLLKDPGLAQYFEVVHPLFWLVLLWQLKRAVLQVHAAGRRDALLRITWWGRVTVEYLGDAPPDPSAYRPVEPTRKPWSDPCWASDLPADLLPEAQRSIFPRICGGSGRLLRSLTKGACILATHPDTS